MADEMLLTELKNIRQELQTIKSSVGQVIHYIRMAESEVPEKMRRFMNYMHDLHDIKYMYEELGHAVPDHHLREMERCDDRFRQLINEENSEEGAFSKVRREMATDAMNKWDHTRALPKPTHTKTSKETDNEARKSEFLKQRIDEDEPDLPFSSTGLPDEPGTEAGQPLHRQPGASQGQEDPHV